MSQAKTLTPQEYQQVFNYVATRKYAKRNELILKMGFKKGLNPGWGLWAVWAPTRLYTNLW